MLFSVPIHWLARVCIRLAYCAIDACYVVG